MKPANRRLSGAICLLAAALLLATCAWPGSEGAPQTPMPPAGPATAGLSAGNPIVPARLRRFDHISAGDGLSHTTVNAILEDHYGFMWFGTDDGLNRYDGRTFTVYKHDPDDARSLSHNRVWSLFEDAAGTLWVGTYGGGLNRYDRDTNRFLRYDSDDFGNVTDEPVEFRNVVRAIAEEPAGVLWIATYGGGLVRLDIDSGVFTSYAPGPADIGLAGHEWITAMLVDDQGQLWLGTSGEGLDRFDPASGQFTTDRHDPGDPDSLGHDRIHALARDATGQIWIGTGGGGLDRYDPETDAFEHYRHDPGDPASLASDYVVSIEPDPAGLLWIGTAASGLDAFFPGETRGQGLSSGVQPEPGTALHFRHDVTDPRSPGSNGIRAIYLNRWGTLWLGTRGGGVSLSDSGSARYAHLRGDPAEVARLGDYHVTALHEDEAGILWIGTATGGLDAFDPAAGTWRHYRHDPADPYSLGNDTVRAIHEEPPGTLWLGTADGFYRFERDSGQFERLAHRPPDPAQVGMEVINAIAGDGSGRLWIATHGRGLSTYDAATGRFRYHLQAPSRLSSNYVNTLLVDDAGVLWIGTDIGLNRYDLHTGAWAVYRSDPAGPHSLGHDWVQALYRDRAGRLWVGTLGGGLDRLDTETGAIRHFREQDGLANDMVLALTENAPPYGGFLWIGTANGLSRLDQQIKTIESFDAGDGLPVNEFSTALQSQSRDLLFGGVGGILSFYPSRMARNPYNPPVVLTSLQQNGQDIDTGLAPEDVQALTLRWPDNSFEFSFAALNYVHPERNEQAYLLEGFDRDWNEIGTRRSGRYTNLPGGTYTLRLQGSNNDGVWNQHGPAITVTVVPPFWQTAWFWGLAGLILAGLAFAGYRLRVRSLQARSQALEQEVQARTAELARESDQRVAVEQALHRHERERAVAEERNRLARELHDSVTQSLYGVTLYSEAAAGHLALGHTERTAEHLRQVQDTADEALAEMRLLVYELRPPILAEEGLVAALQARLQAVEGRAGLKTAFTTNLETRLPPDVEQNLYRIAQEALNNALKHAQARHIRLGLQQEAEAVTLEIEDDGIGFRPEAARDRGGLGLQAMHERAAELGASLVLDTAPGTGTRITVSWAGDSEAPA